MCERHHPTALDMICLIITDIRMDRRTAQDLAEAIDNYNKVYSWTIRNLPSFARKLWRALEEAALISIDMTDPPLLQLDPATI